MIILTNVTLFCQENSDAVVSLEELSCFWNPKITIHNKKKPYKITIRLFYLL